MKVLSGSFAYELFLIRDRRSTQERGWEYRIYCMVSAEELLHIACRLLKTRENAQREAERVVHLYDESDFSAAA